MQILRTEILPRCRTKLTALTVATGDFGFKALDELALECFTLCYPEWLSCQVELDEALLPFPSTVSRRE